MEKVYEVLYNPNCAESVSATVSIHKTLEGAENAMEAHRNLVKSEYEKVMGFGCVDDTDWEWNQSWETRETELLD